MQQRKGKQKKKKQGAKPYRAQVGKASARAAKPYEARAPARREDRRHRTMDSTRAPQGAEHYFTKRPQGEYKEYELDVHIAGLHFTMLTASGTFAAKGLDQGSALLITAADLPAEPKVLDLGCGTGVVGICMMMRHDAQVVFTDVNERAVGLVKKNLTRLGLADRGARIVTGDQYASVTDHDFDAILLNPPQTAGKKVCMEMIAKALEFLKPGGTLQLVARHNVGGRSLSAYMEEVFGNVETISKSGGFRVYLSRK